MLKNGMAIRWIAVLAIVLGIFFRGYHLDQKTFWGDEVLGTVRMLGFTEAEIVEAGPRVNRAADIQAYFHLGGNDHDGGRPLSATVQSLAQEDPQHSPLYYLIVRIWVAAAGTSVLALRTLPAIFGIIAIGAMYWLARELFGNSRVAWIAAALYALSPFAVLYAQEAREYSLWAVITLVSSALLLRAARTGERRWWIGYGASCALGLYVMPLAALVIAAQGVFLIASGDLRRSRVIVHYLVANAAALILLLPWLVSMNPATGLRGFGPMMSVKTPAMGICLLFYRSVRASTFDLGPMTGAPNAFRLAGSAAGAALVALMAYAGWVLYRRFPGTARAFVFALLIVPALPLLGHDLVSGGALVGQTRYLEAVYLGIVLLLASLFHTKIADAKADRLKGAAWTSVFVLTLIGGAISCAISAQAYTWYNKAYERSPAVAEIIDHADHPLVVGDRGDDRGTSRVLELSYYLDPGVAMRVNLFCDVCKVPDPPPIDVLADAAQFRNVFILGALTRELPAGNYTVRQVGVRIAPKTSGPLDMFQAVY
jgi:uncharacterized membrane protein